MKQRNCLNFRIGGLISKLALVTLAIAAFVVPSFAQEDEEAVPGKVMDATNKSVGRAALDLDTGSPPTNFGYRVYLYIGKDQLMIIRPQSGSRSTKIECSYREYKIDAASPKDSSRWTETGSGIATLQMPAEGEVQKINISVTRTRKAAGDNDVSVNEKPQKFVVVLD